MIIEEKIMQRAPTTTKYLVIIIIINGQKYNNGQYNYALKCVGVNNVSSPARVIVFMLALG